MRAKNFLLMLCMLFCFSLPASAQVNSDSAPLQFQLTIFKMANAALSRRGLSARSKQGPDPRSA